METFWQSNLALIVVGLNLWVLSRRKLLTPQAYCWAVIFALLAPFLSNVWPAAVTESFIPKGETVVTTLSPLSVTGESLMPLMLWAYVLIGAALWLRLIWRTWQAYHPCLVRTIEHEGVAVGLTEQPGSPFSIGGFSPKIIFNIQDFALLSDTERKRIIAHEQCHILRRDPELTFMWLSLSCLFWINPMVHWITAQWRFAIELRADDYALRDVNIQTRRDYGHLLLRFSGREKNGRARPCPSANLNHPTRSITMRLNHIMTMSPTKSKPWLALTALTLTAGLTSLAFAGPASVPTSNSIQPLNRVPPAMPKSCPGLDTTTITVRNMNGTDMAEVGTVDLTFKVSPSGQPTHIRVLKSNHACFENAAKDSLAKWTYEQSPTGYADQKTRITFLLVPDEGQTVKDAIKKYGQE